MQLCANESTLKLEQAVNLKSVLLFNLRRTSYDDCVQVLLLMDYLTKVSTIIEMLEEVNAIPDSFEEWMDSMTFSWYENEFTVDGMEILDCIDVFEDDTVLYMCQCHDGTVCQRSRHEPGAFANY